MSRRIPSVAEVVAAYGPKFAHELRTEWAIALVYRPLSFVMTPLFAACGASPGAVTLLGLACALSLPWLALTGGSAAWGCVGALAIAFSVLDCVDGDLARVTGRTSRWGAYADFLSDTVYRIALYSSIGLLVDGAAARDVAPALPVFGDHGGLVAGLACALLAIVARACRLFVEACERHPGDRPAWVPAGATAGNVAIAFLSGLDHMLPFGVLAFGAVGRLDWLLAWLFVYSLGDLVLTQRAAWIRLR